ncbi:cyclic lactone autoinducer peptide [Desulfoscipio gibsoniae]|uniref:Cyclic lactone autoinducer peptide n=1 Tax=Desulfoscipio gibsoniae DSM 7213 TaxID=767817 RepID=R4KLG6_9FIRM|nr:cyclic lactone autoinducer peptide [Desulfoscipio gibsoniae]AGL00486.1 hypothetical protein Desgi_0940 [Desulfoscipio gibsoniae DSM 7213]
MKRVMARLFVFMVSVLLFLASVTAAGACAMSHYQPEVPEALRK